MIHPITPGQRLKKKDVVINSKCKQFGCHAWGELVIDHKGYLMLLLEKVKGGLTSFFHYNCVLSRGLRSWKTACSLNFYNSSVISFFYKMHIGLETWVPCAFLFQKGCPLGNGKSAFPHSETWSSGLLGPRLPLQLAALFSAQQSLWRSAGSWLLFLRKQVLEQSLFSRFNWECGFTVAQWPFFLSCFLLEHTFNFGRTSEIMGPLLPCNLMEHQKP